MKYPLLLGQMCQYYVFQSGAGVGVGMLRGAGDPFFSKFLDLEIYQDSTIVKFVFLPKRVEDADRF